MTARWNDPSWRRDAEAWIREQLTACGYRLAGAIEYPHVRPWGTTLRVPAEPRTLWFKASIPPLAYEVPLLEQLAARRPDCVPTLAAADSGRGWLLTEDAGPILGKLYPDGPPLAAWRDFLRLYAQLQIDTAPAASALIGAGVPDRRLANLVESLERVLDNERLVRPATRAGLDAAQLERVRALIPTLHEAAATLAALELPDCVQHDDLHQWNVCTRDGEYRFIDWGDACISHPLVSLWVPIRHMDRRHTDAARDAFLEPWTTVRPYDELLDACQSALLLAQITGTLKWELITSALADDERLGYEDAVPSRLRTLLELACA